MGIVVEDSASSLGKAPADAQVRVRPAVWKSFGRSQVASLAATVVDFGTLVGLVEIFHVWYVAATACGAALGAVTNFMIGRHWSFEAHEGKVQQQAWRYALVSGGSLLLNSLGVYLLTDHAGFAYPISKACTALLVGFVYNFPMQRAFVFR